MSVNAGKILHRLFYAADMEKARKEFLARLGVDLRRQPEEKATTPKATPKKEEKKGKVCPDTVSANTSGKLSGTQRRKFLYWFRSIFQAANTLPNASW